MARIVDIEGLGAADVERLKQAGISTTNALLERGATPQARAALAAETGISPQLLLRWVNHADLMRIRGVGGQYAELLEASGVDSVPELAKRHPGHLQQRMAQANQEKRLTRKLPTESQVRGWVDQAKELPRRVNH